MTGESSRHTDPIDASRHRFIEASKEGDIETILSLICDDVVWMPPNEESLYGIGEVREWWQEYYHHFRIVTLSETEREVNMFDGWALDCWAYILAIDSLKDSKRIRDDARFMALWKQQSDGGWKMSKVMFNSMRGVGSGTSRFMARLMTHRSKEGTSDDS